MPIDQKQILDKLPQLPTLPAVVQEVVASFNDADLNIAWLANKIAQDQGLSAKVLKVANSSFYALSRKVGSIQDAITVLGFNSVRSLVLSAGMVRAFPSLPGSLFNRQSYWQRSIRVATFARALARPFRLDQNTAFTTGMFHDIGQLVLDLCIPEHFAALLQQAGAAQDLLEIERNALGFDHGELGAEVLRRWNFPQQIEQAVRYCHRPEQLETIDPAVWLIHMAMLLESGNSGETFLAALPQTLCSQLRIGWEDIEACLPKAELLQASTDLASANHH